MTSRTVLIAGASIAGPALAYWLRRYGWEPVVVERAPQLRDGGQNIDVRGAGREVARRMGVEDAIHAANTGELGTRFVGRDGAAIAEFPAGTSDSDGATAELEILRGDLARLLVDRLDGVETVFGDRVTALDDVGDHVTVTFEHGATRDVDLVIAADGINSSTRGLVFGDEVVIRSLGLYTGWFTIPRTDADDPWWRWYNAPGGRSVTLRPDAGGTTRAALSFVSTTTGYEQRSVDDQRALLRTVFADAGWEAERVLAGMDGAADFYFERVAQVHAPRWSSGRIALTGDAAYCASPVSGMGTSLALTGAYVLAGELAAHHHHQDAFRGYERIMRPYVDQAQKLPPGVPAIAHPRTALGLAAFRTALRLGATPVVGRITRGLFAPPADRIDLPGYAHLDLA